MSDLEVFCNVCISKLDTNKKFKKTDVAILLKLLDPTIPDKTLASYKKNNAGWNEGNLLFHFNKIIFPLFLSALKIQTDKVELDPDGATITEKFDFRYLDYLLSGTSKEMKELKKELEEVKDGSNMVPENEYFAMKRDLETKIKRLHTEDNTERLEKKLAEQRKFFEEKLLFVEKESERRIKFYQDLYENLLEKNND